MCVSIVAEDFLPNTGRRGGVSGHETDKSIVFDSMTGNEGMPTAGEPPVTMACKAGGGVRMRQVRKFHL